VNRSAPSLVLLTVTLINGGPVRPVQRPLLWLPVTLVVVVAVAAVMRLGAAALLVGTAAAVGLVLLVDHAYRARRGRGFAPPDLVTMARATLACASAALVTDAVLPVGGRTAPSSAAVGLLVALAATGLVLDGVDGRVARATGTWSTLGARFDMEVDAFLVLVLSVNATRTLGAWVLAIGLARYALLAAERVLPFLRRPVPVRQWSKVVAATQGVVLTVVAADLLPARPATVLVVLALGLLVESFAHQVHWLWRTRRQVALVAAAEPA
jgi:phosphatidylglycerophosphate synthase